MRSPKEVNSYFNKFNKIIENHKLALIHFNDSAKKNLVPTLTDMLHWRRVYWKS